MNKWFFILYFCYPITSYASSSSNNLFVWKMVNFIILIVALGYILKKKLSVLFLTEEKKFKKLRKQAKADKYKINFELCKLKNKLADINDEFDYHTSCMNESLDNKERDSFQSIKMKEEFLKKEFKGKLVHEKFKVLNEIYKTVVKEVITDCSNEVTDNLIIRKKINNKLINSIRE